jgi:DNA (cytosine-5)-methyltransferase 1
MKKLSPSVAPLDPKIDTHLTVIDLFSGAGGMSTGFHRHGKFKIVGAVDIEKGKPSSGIGATNCNSTYEANIGIKPMFADLSTTSPSEIQTNFGVEKGGLDVLISCAPCTGFSQKRARNYIVDDPRNGLVARSALFVEAFMPKFFVMENVKELAKGRHTHHLKRLLEELSRLGYQVRCEVHNLVDFGLPQNRIRTLLIAKLNDKPPPLNLQRSSKIATVRSAIGAIAPLKAGEKSASDPMHVCPTVTLPVLERMRAIPRNGGSWIDIPESLAHLRIPSMDTADPGSYPDIYGRLWWDRPAPTVTRECSSPGNGRYTHPEQDRLLSVREMAILQGFPVDYVFTGPLSSMYRQIGDAVPPLVSAQIAKLIADDIEGIRAPEVQSELFGTAS